MKLERLIGILSILLQHETVTAPYLADKFEVSRRTINRDIDTLCCAGIPICTKQGIHGGISILDNYKMDRVLLSTNEMQDILAGLRSLDSVQGTNRYEQMMEKLSAGSSDFMTGNQSLLIDLSSWNKASLTSKIAAIRRAVEQHDLLTFLYSSPSSEQKRTVEPYYLIFRWANWYLWGFCKIRQDFRLFKLNRMTELEMTEVPFIPRPAPIPDLRNERIFPGGTAVKVLFKPSCKWRLIEDFGADSFRIQHDGNLLFSMDFTDQHSFFSWVMTFGDCAEVLEPKAWRAEIGEALQNMLNVYEKNRRKIDGI